MEATIFPAQEKITAEAGRKMARLYSAETNPPAKTRILATSRPVKRAVKYSKEAFIIKFRARRSSIYIRSPALSGQTATLYACLHPSIPL